MDVYGFQGGAKMAMATLAVVKGQLKKGTGLELVFTMNRGLHPSCEAWPTGIP